MLHCARTILNAIWVDDKKEDESATTTTGTNEWFSAVALSRRAPCHLCAKCAAIVSYSIRIMAGKKLCLRVSTIRIPRGWFWGRTSLSRFTQWKSVSSLSEKLIKVGVESLEMYFLNEIRRNVRKLHEREGFSWNSMIFDKGFLRNFCFFAFTRLRDKFIWKASNFIGVSCANNYCMSRSKCN